MKMPNFKLHETQARASVVFGLLACLGIAALAILVLKGYDNQMKVIHYSTQSSLGKYRKLLVMAATGGSAGLAIVAGLFGFSSLGEKRNKKQGWSWLGLGIAAITFSVAITLLVAWFELSQPIIVAS